jgi:hypothetical protein
MVIFLSVVVHDLDVGRAVLIVGPFEADPPLQTSSGASHC